MFIFKGRVSDLHEIANIISEHNYGPMAFLFLPLDFNGKLETTKLSEHVIDSFISFDTRRVASKFRVMSSCGLPNHESDYLIGVYSVVNPRMTFDLYSKTYQIIIKHFSVINREFEFTDVDYMIDGVSQVPLEENNGFVTDEGNKKVVTGEGLKKVAEEEQNDEE